MFKLGKCPVIRWHDWEVVRAEQDVQIEVCRACNERRVWKLDDTGEATPLGDYWESHIRDFAQPYGYTAKVYFEIYGDKKFKENQKFLEKEAGREAHMEELEREFDKYVREEKTYFT